MDTYRAD